jgi:hypothetical protein
VHARADLVRDRVLVLLVQRRQSRSLRRRLRVRLKVGAKSAAGRENAGVRVPLGMQYSFCFLRLLMLTKPYNYPRLILNISLNPPRASHYYV